MPPEVFANLRRHAKKISIFSFFLLSCAFLHSENFRVHKLIPISFSEISQKISVSSGINDALLITLPEDLTYVSGVELNLKIPEEIITWRDSVAYMLYEKLNPEPKDGEVNYYGERVSVATIPGNFSLTVYIPTSKDFSIKDSPYSVKLPLSKATEGIFLRFMMVMKGVPESLENSILEITAKPVLKNKGKLALSVLAPKQNQDSAGIQAEKKYSVFIDDALISDSEYQNKFLSTGEHHLSIVSDSYRNELRTFRIEQAKTTALSINLRGIEPLLKILCPTNSNIFLDGSQIQVTSEPIQVTQGEHSVRFVIGDYEITKTVNAMNGRTYSVNLNVDATVSEED